MDTFKDVKIRTRGIGGDPYGDWMTDELLAVVINHVYELQINYLAQTCTPFEENVVEITSIPAGTSDLTSYHKGNGPLHGLIEPYVDGVDWKQAGLTPDHYLPARKVTKLPDITPAVPGPRFRCWWEFRTFRMFITPMTFDIDLRVRGDFRPAKLVKDDDVITIHPNMAAVLAEESAAAAWRERQNAGALQSYELTATAALDDIANLLVHGEESTPIRLGRY